jgi:hypothetical protein
MLVEENLPIAESLKFIILNKYTKIEQMGMGHQSEAELNMNF